MRRAVILTLALLAGCARAERPGVDMAPAREVTLDDFVGTWAGELRAEGSDAVVAHVELLASPREDGWSFTVASAANPAWSTTAPAQVISIGGDSVVVEAGPFASVLREGEMVSTRSIYRLRGNGLAGVIHASYFDGTSVVLNAEARKRP